MTTNNLGGGLKSGRAEVIVVDNLGNAVSNAVVSGEFSGNINEAIASSTPTDNNGVTVIETTQGIKRLRNLTFCVTGITHATLQDLVAAPGDFCSSL